MKISINLKRCCIAVIMIAVLMQIQTVAFAEEPDIESAKNGILEIYTGLTDSDGNFYKLKNSTGFLVANGDDGAFIVTNNHSINATSKEKAALIKQHKSLGQSYGMSSLSYRVVVKGDVTEEVTLLSNSKVEDFCILQADKVINEKTAIPLGDSDKIAENDTVFSLGFSEYASELDYTYFDASDVISYSGYVTQKENMISDVAYIQHSSMVDEGTSGGPLVNSEGYVIGINNVEFNEEGISSYYSLPINSVKEILDNRGIFYVSDDWNSTYTKLKSTYEECSKIIADREYKSSSLEELTSAVQEATTLFDSFDNPSVQTMANMLNKLNDAKSKIVKKMPKTTIVIYVLAGINVLLLALLIRLLVLNKKSVKKEKKSRIKRKSAKQKNNKHIKGANQKTSDPLPALKQSNSVEDNNVVNINSNENTQDLFDATVCIPEDKSDYDMSDADEEKTVCLIFDKPTDQQSVFKNRKTIARIRQIQTGRLTTVDKQEFVIGKSPEKSDFVISNSAVSRTHAAIRWIDSKYYIFDLNSSNGTYINNVMVNENGMELKDRDVIMLANEAFVFEVINI
ncbi:MAG: FHA domain-containing protein [Acutalibacteraceae bacterium]|nr:FHA domain-containing protein [Acutalibacteraceae bacterium]